MAETLTLQIKKIPDLNKCVHMLDLETLLGFGVVSLTRIFDTTNIINTVLVFVFTVIFSCNKIIHFKLVAFNKVLKQ